jgi:hypothetical protein
MLVLAAVFTLGQFNGNQEGSCQTQWHIPNLSCPRNGK